MEEVRYFHKAASNTEIKSIGLVFEPNLFRIIYFSDMEGKEPIGERNSSDYQLLEKDEILKYTPLFAFDFTEQFTLVPHGMFNENHYSQILKFSTNHDRDEIRDDRVLGYDCTIISSRSKVNEEIIQKKFPGLKLRHILGSLLELGRNKFEGDKDAILIYRSGSVLCLCVLDRKNLLFANSIQSRYLSDLEYFIHYVSKQLNLDSTNPVYVFGNSIDTDPLVEKISSYFESIHRGFPSSRELYEEIDVAEHWLALHASTCAL